MQTNKLIGNLLIAGSVGVFIPYTALSIIFNYPAILRQDTAEILTAFHAGGSRLIFVWLAFALLGMPLIAAYLLISQRFENRFYWIRLASTIGVISGIVQVIGLLRWVFVVPVLADDFVNATQSGVKQSIEVSFKLMHQFGGVLLGEHLGQLLTVAWTFMIAFALKKLAILPKWAAIFGYISAAIYFLAQTELLATVIPAFPVVGWAGFLGSTLWLIWLIITGIYFRKNKY